MESLVNIKAGNFLIFREIGMTKKKTTPKKRTPSKKKGRWQKMQEWHKTMVVILATAAVLGLGGKVISFVGDAASSVDNRWTHSEVFQVKTAELEEEIQLVGQRLQQKITQDKIDWRHKRMAYLLSQYGSFEKMPPLAREEYLRLQKEIQDLRSGKQLAF